VPLSVDDLGIDLPGRHIGIAADILINEPLVVPQVQVGLSPVDRDEYLPMLIGTHRSGIDVQVRIELLDGNLQPSRLQDTPESGGRDSFAN